MTSILDDVSREKMGYINAPFGCYKRVAEVEKPAEETIPSLIESNTIPDGSPIADSTPTDSATSETATAVTDASVGETVAVGDAVAQAVATAFEYPGFSFVGEKCGTDAVANAFSSLPRLLDLKNDDKPHFQPQGFLNTCIKKCEVTPSPGNLPCVGIHVNNVGACHLVYLPFEGGSEHSVLEEPVYNPFGCYKRDQVPSVEMTFPEEFTYIGSDVCESTETRQYKTKWTEHSEPYSAANMISYCADMCSKNKACVGFAAKDTCLIYFGGISDALPVTPKESYLSEPFGCYKRVAQPAQPQESEPADTTVGAL